MVRALLQPIVGVEDVADAEVGFGLIDVHSSLQPMTLNSDSFHLILGPSPPGGCHRFFFTFSIACSPSVANMLCVSAPIPSSPAASKNVTLNRPVFISSTPKVSSTHGCQPRIVCIPSSIWHALHTPSPQLLDRHGRLLCEVLWHPFRRIPFLHSQPGSHPEGLPIEP